MPNEEKGFDNLKIPADAPLSEVYRMAREAFSAADLQKYTEIEEGIPAEQVLEELEVIHREESEKRNKKA